MDSFKRLEGKKVLLVGADEWIQNLLRMYFRFSGCHLEGCGNADLALDAVRKKDFDIVVSEYWLHEMDGLSLLAMVKQQQRDAVLILISAYPTEDIRRAAARLGIDDYIETPLTTERLGGSLERLFPGPILETVSGSPA